MLYISTSSFKEPPPDTSAKVINNGKCHLLRCPENSIMPMLLPSQQKLTLSLACRHITLTLILAGLPVVGSPLYLRYNILWENVTNHASLRGVLCIIQWHYHSGIEYNPLPLIQSIISWWDIAGFKPPTSLDPPVVIGAMLLTATSNS